MSQWEFEWEVALLRPVTNEEAASRRPARSVLAEAFDQMRLNPATLIAPHSHDDDEIYYVAEGSLHWGESSLHAGGSIFIGAETPYSFRTGPQGARLLNFRARADHSFRPAGAQASTAPAAD